MNVITALHGDSATLTPHGDIDFESLDQLRACVTRLPSAVKNVEWDLRATPFMDMAGLHLLSAAHGQPERCTTVAHLQAQPLRLLEMAASVFPHLGWDRYLPSPVAPPAA